VFRPTAPVVEPNHHINMRNSTTLQERMTVLSTTAEYAVRASLYLARHATAEPLAARDTAVALGMPENYLSKTLHALTRAGVLESRRGPSGGFRLAISPTTLTLARIVDAVDPPRKARQCLVEAGACDPEHPCALHQRWQTVEQELRRPLEETTIQDLLELPLNPER
jgi:Rrf2 family iron-sulfur cluster assembly transcriptional regulator